MTAEMGGDLAGAGSSSGGRAPAGAVVVPADVEAAAPAAPPPAIAGAAAGALVAPVAAARAAWTRLSSLLALAAALFALGCAAAGLAFFAIMLPPTGKACVPTAGEVARLRTASGYLLLAASTQTLAATMVLLVPARPFAILGTLLGVLTSYHACDVLGLLVTCHGTAHGALDFYLWLFLVVLLAATFVGVVVSLR